MKIIYIAIIPLLILSIISVLFGKELTGLDIKYYVYDAVDQDIDSKTIKFNILDDVKEGLSILISLIVVVGLLGINILGSGLTGEATKIMSTLILYIGIWCILTILSWDFIFANDIIGFLIYIFFAIFYVIGVANMLRGEG